MLDTINNISNELMIPGTPPAVFWAMISLGMISQGIGKSGFAGGIGILCYPLMALVMKIEHVAAVMLPMLVLFDLNAIYHFRSQKDIKKVISFFPFCILGILIGGVFWVLIEEQGIAPYERSLKCMVGIIAIVFAIYILFKETIFKNLQPFKPGFKSSLITGILTGISSTLAHAAGPIVSMFMFVQGMNKSLFVGTVAWTFALINISKIPIFAYAGLFTTVGLKITLILFPLVPIGSLMGKMLHDRINQKAFNWTLMICVFIAGIQLISGVNLILIISQY